MANFRRLAELGMVPTLAKQLATQIEGADVTTRKLVEMSMVPPVARAVTGMIASKPADTNVANRRLHELGVPTGLANEIVSQIRAQV